ncbi:MAG TPA: helix-turn-helix domain-containing protein [Rhizomicrobium sp.]|jgi:AcrR family transcriptional regulator
MALTKTARRAPKQARAKATIDAILEATAQILEKQGEKVFTTNHVAERAGVSIGSLYQYFPDKRAILREMAKRETDALREAASRMPAKDRDEQYVHRLIGAFAGRPHLRRVVVKSLTADVADMPMEKIGADVDRAAHQLEPDFKLSRIDGYILSRAVIGIVRAAVIEDAPFLYKPEFAQALVRLMRSYRDASVRPAAVSRRSGSVRPARSRSARDRA